MVRPGRLSRPGPGHGPGGFWHVPVTVPARSKASDDRVMTGTQKYVKMLRIDLFVHYIIKKPLVTLEHTYVVDGVITY